MTAGLCGKRQEFEETFGSPASAPSAKRSRCLNYGSPIRIAGVGVADEDKVSVLLRMFPSMDRKVLETILNSHDNNIDDAIKNLHALCLGETSVRDEPVLISSELKSEENEREGAINAQNTEAKAAVFLNVESNLGIKETHGSSWVDIFVQEMMNASDWHDVRNRAINILESFKQMIVAQSTSSKEQEIASLKEQLQCLLRDNQILKRAVAIQHEHNSEFVEKLKEVQQLKNIISQYQEQVRTLEVSMKKKEESLLCRDKIGKRAGRVNGWISRRWVDNQEAFPLAQPRRKNRKLQLEKPQLDNYTLKLHLQRAQEATSIPGRFHPDIF